MQICQEELFLEKLLSLVNLTNPASQQPQPVPGAAQLSSIRMLMRRLDRTPLIVRRGNCSAQF